MDEVVELIEEGCGIYSGVGSRCVNRIMYDSIVEIARYMDDKGWRLRTGDAIGCDEAFRSGARNKDVYISKPENYDNYSWDKATDIARKYHPKFDELHDMAKVYHIRNSFQILGDDLESPSDLVICYTKDGAVSDEDRSIRTGGTGQVISIADDYDVNIVNLGKMEHRDVFLNEILPRYYN